MTSCDDGAERVIPDLGPGVEPFVGADPSTVLLGEHDGGAVWTLRREGDVHDAVVRGLAAYVSTMSIPHAGRLFDFHRVTPHSADASITDDDATDGPVAAVFGEQVEGMYGAPPNTPALIPVKPHDLLTATKIGLEGIDPARPHWLYETATYSHERLVVRVWCDDEPMRRAVIMALEDLAWPTRGAGGFRLRLDRYHGAVARYRLVSQMREGDIADILTNRWIVSFRFSVIAPTIRVHRGPAATIRSPGSVT